MSARLIAFTNPCRHQHTAHCARCYGTQVFVSSRRQKSSLTPPQVTSSAGLASHTPVHTCVPQVRRKGRRSGHRCPKLVSGQDSPETIVSGHVQYAPPPRNQHWAVSQAGDQLLHRCVGKDDLNSEDTREANSFLSVLVKAVAKNVPCTRTTIHCTLPHNTSNAWIAWTIDPSMLTCTAAALSLPLQLLPAT